MITVVGPGRIGTTLFQLATRAGIEAALIRRGEPIPAAAGPVVVCTRNDDVAAVAAASPRPSDLCFVQNGALLPWLEAAGLEQTTQGLLYFAVPAVGSAPEVGAESVFFGPHAATLVYLLTRGGIAARALGSAGELRDEIAVKLLWTAIFGLLGDLHRETVLATTARREEVGALVAELLPICHRGLGASIGPEEVVARLLKYSLAIGSWRASVKEWRWRNGWLVAQAEAQGCPLPLHAAACRRSGAGG